MGAKALQIRGGFPEPPVNLGEQGKLAWDSGRDLWLDGTLKQRDLMNWRLYAEAIDEKHHCEKILKKDGEYQVAMNGCWVQHPALKRRQCVENVIRKYSVAFGLIPDARTKRPAVSQGVAARPR